MRSATGRYWCAVMLTVAVLAACLGLPAAMGQTAGSLDLTFDPGIGADGDVTAAAVQADGKILIGGSFRNINGVVRNGIARLNADGSVDVGFDPGAGASPGVYRLAVQGDGKIVVGGGFNAVGGVARNRAARLNADGSVDATFNPGTGANNWVLALALQPDGKVLVGGSFTAVNGVGRMHLARLNPDGSLDTGFVPATENSVRVIVAQGDGKILIGGDFFAVGGARRMGLARLNADGSLDPSFVPMTGGIDSVFAVVVQDDGRILVSGYSYLDLNKGRIARLNADGSPDPAFVPGAGPSNWANAVALQADGRIVIGGRFVTIDGVARNRIARLNADGSPDTVFDPGSGVDGNPPVGVNVLALQADRKIIMGGAFDTVGGVRRNRIARLNGDPSRQPDLAIRYAYGTSVAGNDVYNVTGENQSQIQPVTPGLTAAFVVTIQNDAAAADAVTLTGPAGGAGWAINYFDAPTGGNDITAEVTGAGWTTGSLGAGAAREIRVELSPAVSLPGGRQVDVRVTAASTGDPTARDTVLASARTPLPFRPDLLVRLAGEPDFFFAGGNVYNVTGQNQTKTQSVATGTTASYVVALQNDADRPDRFRVTGIGSRLGWTIRYFDAASGGADITGRITAGGWISPVLAPGGSIQLRVEVVAGSTVALGAQAGLRIMAASVGDGARQDVVIASTRLTSLRGNTLIADAFNFRVIEVDAAKAVVWQYGTGVQGTGANQLRGAFRARRLPGGNTLIVDHEGQRVIEVRPDRTIAWQFGKPDIAGGANLWAYPTYAERLANGNTLISSRGEGAGSFGDQTIYHRLIEVTPDKIIVWRDDYRSAPTPPPPPIFPNSAVRLAQGRTLITDAGNGTVIEVAAPGTKPVWSYGTLNQLLDPRMAIRLSNGNTLITDLYNHRVIEVNSAKTLVWQYGGPLTGGIIGPNQLFAPNSAVRLSNGNTLIADGGDRVVEVTANRTIAWQYGTGASGSGFNQLSFPRDAQRLGPQ